MTIEDLQLAVQQLPHLELLKFGEWFDVFREASAFSEAEVFHDLTVAQREELLLRWAEFISNPSPNLSLAHPALEISPARLD